MSFVKPVEQYFESDEIDGLSEIFVPNKDEEEFINSKLKTFDLFDFDYKLLQKKF